MHQVSEEYLRRQRLQQDRQKNKTKEGVRKIVKKVRKVDMIEVSSLLKICFILAIIGDLFGLIPLVGNFFNAFFGVVLLILYFFEGLGSGIYSKSKKKADKIWARRLILSLAEWIPFLSILPMLTTNALIEIISRIKMKKKSKKFIHKK